MVLLLLLIDWHVCFIPRSSWFDCWSCVLFLGKHCFHSLMPLQKWLWFIPSFCAFLWMLTWLSSSVKNVSIIGYDRHWPCRLGIDGLFNSTNFPIVYLQFLSSVFHRSLSLESFVCMVKFAWIYIFVGVINGITFFVPFQIIYCWHVTTLLIF